MQKEGRIYKSKQYTFQKYDSIARVRKELGIRDRRSYDDILAERKRNDYSYKYAGINNYINW
jgi:hypothetical protein